MATNKEYIEWVCEQVKSAGEIRSRKMFGEYMVYCDNKPVLLVCDNMVFVKELPETKAIFAKYEYEPESGFPYSGAKSHYILDCENQELASEMTQSLAAITPFPKPKKRKSS